jgi:hypothetical protein
LERFIEFRENPGFLKYQKITVQAKKRPPDFGEWQAGFAAHHEESAN